MKKILVLLLILIIAPVIAGIYGVFHDQLTYTISPEYYTKFKFYQFGLTDNNVEAIFPNPRISVSFVGFLATWWMGIPIGLLLCLTGLLHSNWKNMFVVTMKSFLVTVIVAFLIGLVGLGFGHFYLSKLPRQELSNWYLPLNLKEYRSFISVGSMHNFSYIGGVIGLVCGIFYSVYQKVLLKPSSRKLRSFFLP